MERGWEEFNMYINYGVYRKEYELGKKKLNWATVYSVSI